MKRYICSLIISAGVVLSNSLDAAPVDYEAEFTPGAPETTNWGYDVSVGAWWYPAAQWWASGPTYPNNNMIYSVVNGAKSKALVVGSDITLVGKTQDNGGPFSWNIDNGSFTGSNTMGGTPTEVAPVNWPLKTGLSNTMHTVEIENKGPGAASEICVFIDKLVAEQPVAQTITRVEQTDFTYADESLWVKEESADYAASTEAYGGSFAYTTADGASWSYQFSGTAAAIIELHRIDYGSYSWEIRDSANNLEASGTSTENQVAGGILYRWPNLLANNLVDGQHTLTVTKTGGFLVAFDGFSYLPSSSSNVSDWTLY